MDDRIMEAFASSTKRILKEMTGITMEEGTRCRKQGEFCSLGVTTAISFAGKYKGQFILNLSLPLATAISCSIMGGEYPNPKDKTLLAAISELNNVIAGDASTILNNAWDLGLRITPPLVFTGANAIVSLARIPSFCMQGYTLHGNLELYVGVQGR